jgi:hypothetical protein
MTQTGYEYDSSVYYRARYYDPSIGRFISEDPLGFNGDGPNFYAYVENKINRGQTGRFPFFVGGRLGARYLPVVGRCGSV